MNYPTNEEITQNKRQRRKKWTEKIEEQKIWRLNNGENGKAGTGVVDSEKKKHAQIYR